MAGTFRLALAVGGQGAEQAAPANNEGLHFGVDAIVHDRREGPEKASQLIPENQSAKLPVGLRDGPGQMFVVHTCFCMMQLQTEVNVCEDLLMQRLLCKH